MTEGGADAATALRQWGALFSATLVAYPWLHPLARGPSITVEPLLVGWACSIGLLAINAGTALRMNAALLFAALAWIVLYGVEGFAHGISLVQPAIAGPVFAAAIVLACATVATSARDIELRAIAWGWVIAAAASALAALLQYFGLERSLHGAVSWSTAHQAFANLRQKNQLATLLAIGIAALGWLVYRSPRLKTAGLAVGALLCTGLAVTASRTGLLEFAVLLALWCWWHRGQRKLLAWVLVAAACYALGAVVASAFHSGSAQDLAPLLRRLGGDAPDCQGRKVLWSSAVDLALAHPWIGIGPGEFPFAIYSTNHQPHFCALVENAHNLPLHLAAELGLPAALAFIAIVLAFVVKAAPWRASEPARQLGWAVLAVLAVHSLLEYPLWYAPFQAALGLAMGLVAREHPAIDVRRGIAISVALVLAIGVAMAAWDYARISQLFMPPQARWPSLRQDPFARIDGGLIYRDQVAFARLMSLPVTPEAADTVYDLSGRLLHFSPEPRVVERRIASAIFLRRRADAKFELDRYSWTYPEEAKGWKASHPDAP
jgi:O-antigen ligase